MDAITATATAILNDPTASNWLKRAILDMERRDIVDAIRDAETLAAILNARGRALMVAAIEGAK